MRPVKLYIIGNGFDLWHGIPSSYSQFKEYVKRHRPEILDAIDDYIPADEGWSDLEGALAGLDVDGIVDDLSVFMPSYADDSWSDAGHHDFQYEVDRVVQLISTQLRATFGEWIRTLEMPVPGESQRRLSTLDVQALFLNFNYTSTLEDLYAVPDSQVLHIHGYAKIPDSELVLGHAWNPERHRSLNDRLAIEDMDTRLVEAHDILDDYFSRTFKPSDRIILKHQDFFNRLSSIKTVYVLGHSLSEVDRPYIRALLGIPAVADSSWYLACRSEDERGTKRDRLVQLGVQGPRALTVLWDEL